jgi:hypothetical protein
VILPRLPENSVVLNWSNHGQWPRFSVPVLLFRAFAGSREFNPIALVFERFSLVARYRFWQPFRDLKHGRPEALRMLEERSSRMWPANPRWSRRRVQARPPRLIACALARSLYDRAGGHHSGRRRPSGPCCFAVAEFIESDPEAVWCFILRWACSEDEDLRMAIATCALEHLLEHHFDVFISRVEGAARSNPLFAQTVSSCWKFGESRDPSRAARLDRLVASLRGPTG